MERRIALVLLAFATFTIANGETEPTGACDTGFEMLLTKLETIEERIVELEATVKNVLTPKVEQEQVRANPSEEYIGGSHISENVYSSKVEPDQFHTNPYEKHFGGSNISETVYPKKVEPEQFHTNPYEQQFGESHGGIMLPSTTSKVPSFKADVPLTYPIGIEPTEEQLSVGENNIYSSCRELPSRVSGKYLIRISRYAEPINLLCDMTSEDGGWIIVQNRFNGSESFYRNWTEYETGFGNLDGEFWIGLERISTLVNNGRQWEIMFWLQNFAGTVQYSRFVKFRLGTAIEQYQLKLVRGYRDNAGDSISRHVGSKFTTYDRDNDAASYNCAKKHRGGWWYHRWCITSHLNGMYGNAKDDQSNSWLTMKPNGFGLKASKIMIRERV